LWVTVKVLINSAEIGYCIARVTTAREERDFEWRVMMYVPFCWPFDNDVVIGTSNEEGGGWERRGS
jgi:hypothetical protein